MRMARATNYSVRTATKDGTGTGGVALIKERPILFSGAMVRAILEGHKSQTRRVVKPQPVVVCGKGGRAFHQPNGDLYHRETPYGSNIITPCPHGQPGERLWVKETWGYRGTGDKWHSGVRQPWTDVFVKYPADNSEATIRRPVDDESGIPRQRARLQDETEEAHDEYINAFWRRWTPSIHMPRWASRITLEITDVRVEQVQEISEADAEAEGLISDEFPIGGEYIRKYGLEGWEHRHFRISPVDAFERLWDSINAERAQGAFAWAQNPWVWCITFKRV